MPAKSPTSTNTLYRKMSRYFASELISAVKYFYENVKLYDFFFKLNFFSYSSCPTTFQGCITFQTDFVLKKTQKNSDWVPFSLFSFDSLKYRFSYINDVCKTSLLIATFT